MFAGIAAFGAFLSVPPLPEQALSLEMAALLDPEPKRATAAHRTPIPKKGKTVVSPEEEDHDDGGIEEEEEEEDDDEDNDEPSEEEGGLAGEEDVQAASPAQASKRGRTAGTPLRGLSQRRSPMRAPQRYRELSRRSMLPRC